MRRSPVSDDAMEIAKLLAAASGGAGVTGFFGWLQRRTSNSAENKSGEAAVILAAARLQEVLNAAVENASKRTEAEIEELRRENDGLRSRIENLEGEKRQYDQIIESLKSILDRQGIDWKAATEPGALLVVEAGEATVTKPGRRRKP